MSPEPKTEAISATFTLQELEDIQGCLNDWLVDNWGPDQPRCEAEKQVFKRTEAILARIDAIIEGRPL